MNLLDLLSMNRQQPDPTQGAGHVFNPYGKNSAPERKQSGSWMNKPALGGSMSRGDLLLASMGMLSGRNFQEGMGNAAQYMAYGMDKANERQKEQQQKAELQKAMQGMDLTPEQKALMGINPGGVTQALTERAFATPTQIEGKAINNRLVNPMTGEVMGDYSDPAAPNYERVTTADGIYEYIPGQPDSMRKIGEAPVKAPLVQNTVSTGSGMPELSPLEKKMDEYYADTLVNWNTGGQSDWQKNQTQINNIADALENGGENLTGFLIGITPKWALEGINPEAVDAQEQVEEVVQRNLRIVLGAQFTQKEGERLIERAYNRRLKPEMNAARVRRLAQLLEGRAQQLQSLNEYVRQNRTAAGWNGTLTSVDQMLDDLDQISGGSNSPVSGELPPGFVEVQ